MTAVMTTAIEAAAMMAAGVSGRSRMMRNIGLMMLVRAMGMMGVMSVSLRVVRRMMNVRIRIIGIHRQETVRAFASARASAQAARDHSPRREYDDESQNGQKNR